MAALLKLTKDDIDEIFDEMFYYSNKTRNKLQKSITNIKFYINQEDVSYFLDEVLLSKIPIEKITEVKYGTKNNNKQAEDERHDGSYIITINGKPTLYFWDYATNKPSKLFKPKTVTSGAESKVFAYHGQIITASSKQEAIQKIVADLDEYLI